MFNLSQKMEEKVAKTIDQMFKKEEEYRAVDGSNNFYVSTQKNKKDILLGKTKKGKTTYYLHQKSPF